MVQGGIAARILRQRFARAVEDLRKVQLRLGQANLAVAILIVPCFPRRFGVLMSLFILDSRISPLFALFSGHGDEAQWMGPSFR